MWDSAHKKDDMGTIILGGGLAGLTLANYLNGPSTILEKEEAPGGLCRSFKFNGIMCDMGPHVLFSKNRNTLSEITALIKTSLIRRSNKILHQGRMMKYPFENDLSSLDEHERDHCLNSFLENENAESKAENMYQFFLKTFGSGITDLYLAPYNKKIWKYDPSLMDLQMVERIPRPPAEDVINSAKGIETEGYQHQLHFHYPQEGGIERLITELMEKCSNKAKVISYVNIEKIASKKRRWVVETDKGRFKGTSLVNCMPLHELFNYIDAPDNILETLNRLQYNSIYIVAVHAKEDSIGNNFAVYSANKDVIFHRLSKVNFLGDNYSPKDGSSIILAEVTCRSDSRLACENDDDILQRVLEDLDRLDLLKKRNILDTQIKFVKYAYVIYDLDHRKNTDTILAYLSRIGIHSCGRFAEFEYLNMDAVFEHSRVLAEKLNRE